MKLLKITYILPLLLLTILSACSSDSITDDAVNPGTDNSDTDGNVTFKLGTTRGALTPAVNDDELISSYLIVVTQGDKIVKVLKAPSLPAAEMHSVKASIPVGAYKVYAFANIPFTAAGDWLYGKFTEGAAMPDLSTMYYGDATFRNGMTGAIPMSNSVDGMDLTVLSDKGNATYGIEVVRMLAMVEFQFMNSSSEDITVSKVAMGPLTTAGTTTDGFIPLSWYNDATALSLYSVDDKKYGTETYTHTITSPITLASGNVTTRPSTSFYIIESNPDPITKQFNLAFTVRRGSETEEIRYALLDKSLVAEGTNLDNDDDRSPFIRRNDWLRIPIDLGDYEFRLEARTYPPIGGYPEAEIEETESNEFVVKFDGGGEFSIRPFVRKFSDGDNWFGLDNTAKIQGTPVITVDDTDGIFLTEPTLNATSEIRGRMKVAPGKQAIITLTVKVITSTSPLVTKVLTRKIFVTQK